MANLLECKICGGNIIPNSDGITGKCESCGEMMMDIIVLIHKMHN